MPVILREPMTSYQNEFKCKGNRLKIVYLASSTIPSRLANSIHVMKMCQGFARNGHDVVMLVPNRRDDMEPGICDVFSYYGVEKCFDIHRLPWLPIKGRGYIYGLIAGEKAKRLQPDLVYCRNVPGCFIAAYLGLPVIFETHSPIRDKGGINEWMFHAVIKSSRFKQLVAITHTLKHYYETNYPQTKGKIQVLPDAADPVPDTIIPVELPRKDKRLQVGYVGHLYKGKGMEVVSRLAPLCPWADFHVLGGSERDIKYWKRECEDCANISFHGYVHHSQVFPYILAFDVVLLPNQQQVSVHGGGGDIGQWTSPLKAFEYMAAGRAIVASDLPVLREIIEDGRNGLLVPPVNVEAWCCALTRIRGQRDMAKAMGACARVDFEEKYTWDIRARNIIGNFGDPGFARNCRQK